MKTRSMRIVIVDGNEITRKGLEAVIGEADESYKVFATFTRLNELESFIEDQRVEMVIIDDEVIDLPEIIRLLSHIRHSQPGTGIVILSKRRDGYYIQQIIRYGSAGFILKTSNLSQQLLIA